MVPSTCSCSSQISFKVGMPLFCSLNIVKRRNSLDFLCFWVFLQLGFVALLLGCVFGTYQQLFGSNLGLGGTGYLVNQIWHFKQHCHTLDREQRSAFSVRGMSTKLFVQQVVGIGSMQSSDWSFMRGSRIILSPKVAGCVPHRRSYKVSASWFTNSQIANGVFTLGTVAVLPFYTLMVLAPKAELTKKIMESTIPYVVLGLLYAYLLYLSWTPDTIQLMFASKYWLPELCSIGKMFSSEMTLASAWIHLLAVDLFSARQVYQDGLENEIETRHSVSLCLLFCPIGIVSHVLTKVLSNGAGNTG